MTDYLRNLKVLENKESCLLFVFSFMPLSGIQPDKWKHIVVGALLGAAGQWTGRQLFGWNEWWLALLVFLSVAAIAYGFELFSKFSGKGHYEVWDAIASVIGGVIGIGVMLPLS